MILSGAGRTFETGPPMRLPPCDGHERSRVRADVSGVGTNEAVVRALLDDMRGPTGDARDDKERGEHRRGDAAEVIGAGAVEIEIGKEFLFSPHDLLDALGNRVKSLIAPSRSEFLRPRLDDIGARVGNLVEAMAEANDEFLGGDQIEYSLFRFIGGVEPLDQLNGRLVRAAVQRPAQRA